MKNGNLRVRGTTVLAIVIALLAIVGVAFAATSGEDNTVGSRQLKAKAVTRSKIADSAVNGAKVRRESLSRKDIDVSTLPAVPSAQEAESAGQAETLNGRSATCPPATTLIRGFCLGTEPQGPVLGVRVAADRCAEVGGSLPTVTQLLSAKQIALGNGSSTNAVFTDSYVFDERPKEGGGLGRFGETVVVFDGGQKTVIDENPDKEIIAEYHYLCRYPLIR